jgi:hypothetical protein
MEYLALFSVVVVNLQPLSGGWFFIWMGMIWKKRESGRRFMARQDFPLILRRIGVSYNCGGRLPS